MSVDIRQAVVAWVFDSDGRVLLIRENYGGHRYGPPGGAVESGESPHDAICREVEEETCASFRPQGLVGVYHFVYPGGRLTPWLGFAFAGEVGGEVRLPASGEIAEVGWFDPRSLPGPVTNLLLHGLPDAIASRRGIYRRVELE